MEEVPPLEEVPSVMSRIKNQTTITAKVEVDEVHDKSFGGFKKGFLFNNAPKFSHSTTGSNQTEIRKNEKIPHLKARPQKSNLVLKEVQEAMSDEYKIGEFQNNLSLRIEANPDVSHVLSDPKWLIILGEFQNDTQKAMEKYKDDHEVKETMQKLCKVFGDSFLHMAPSTLTEEEHLAKQLLDSPRVQSALSDKFIITVMDHQKKGQNDLVHRLLQNADLAQRQHIQTLIDHGLFSFIS